MTEKSRIVDAEPSMKRWLREPLVQFLLLGALLFAVYTWSGRGAIGESSKERKDIWD